MFYVLTFETVSDGTLFFGGWSVSQMEGAGPRVRVSWTKDRPKLFKSQQDAGIVRARLDDEFGTETSLTSFRI